MFDSWDEDVYEIDVKEIKKLYELRHSCNVFGIDYVSKELQVSTKIIRSLYHSNVHGSHYLKQFFEASHDEFVKIIKRYEQEAEEKQRSIKKIQEKNERLISDLKQKRENFAGIGTNKTKRRLNKIALTDPVAKALRLSLEIEDKSISAKNSYGKYQDKIYNQKTTLIVDLCDLFKLQGWNYGIQASNLAPTTHVIYFEIPGCEQISWHVTVGNNATEFPEYDGQWDKKQNSTLDKLENTIKDKIK